MPLPSVAKLPVPRSKIRGHLAMLMIAEHGELAEQAPSLHTVIQAAREDAWEGDAELPHHDVYSLARDEAHLEGYREHLSTL